MLRWSATRFVVRFHLRDSLAEKLIMLRYPGSTRPSQSASKKKHLQSLLLTLLSTPVALSAFADDDPAPKVITLKVEATEAKAEQPAEKKKQPLKVEKAVPQKQNPPKLGAPPVLYPGAQHPGAQPIDAPFPGAAPSGKPMPGAPGFALLPGQPGPAHGMTGPQGHFVAIPAPSVTQGNDLLAPGGPIWKQILELEREKLKAQAQAELTEMKFKLFAEQAEEKMHHLKEMLHEKEKHFTELHEKATNGGKPSEDFERAMAESEAQKRELKTVIGKLEQQLEITHRDMVELERKGKERLAEMAEKLERSEAMIRESKNTSVRAEAEKQELRTIVEKLEQRLREALENAERTHNELEELRRHPQPHPQEGHDRPHPGEGMPHGKMELPPEVHHLIEQSQRWEREIGELRAMVGRLLNQWRQSPFQGNSEGRPETDRRPETIQRRPAEPLRPEVRRPDGERPNPERRPETDRRGGDQPRPDSERRDG